MFIPMERKHYPNTRLTFMSIYSSDIIATERALQNRKLSTPDNVRLCGIVRKRMPVAFILKEKLKIEAIRSSERTVVRVRQQVTSEKPKNHVFITVRTASPICLSTT